MTPPLTSSTNHLDSTHFIFFIPAPHPLPSIPCDKLDDWGLLLPLGTSTSIRLHPPQRLALWWWASVHGMMVWKSPQQKIKIKIKHYPNMHRSRQSVEEHSITNWCMMKQGVNNAAMTCNVKTHFTARNVWDVWGRQEFCCCHLTQCINVSPPVLVQKAQNKGHLTELHYPHVLSIVNILCWQHGINSCHANVALN